MKNVLGFVAGTFEGYYLATKTDLNPLNGVDAKSVWDWMDNYCRDHPVETVMIATTTCVVEHSR